LLLGLIGAMHAVWLCGSILWAADSPIWRQPPGDIAAGLIGAEAFLKDVWRWPAAATAHLLSDSRPISIAYTDSMPVLMMVLKALGTPAAIVPPFAAAILIGQVLQAVAAGCAPRVRATKLARWRLAGLGQIGPRGHDAAHVARGDGGRAGCG